MDYSEYTFTLSELDPWRDVLISILSEYPFETFQHTDSGIQGYIQTEFDSEDLLVNLDTQMMPGIDVKWERVLVETENWNQTWESHFDPILIDDQCYIRASFHPAKPEVPFEIVIDPKMAFGTGHHQTTHMMAQWILENSWEDQSVLDMGCGTLVLGILARLKGAKRVVGIDIDEWAYDNAVLNCTTNNCSDIEAVCGDASALDAYAKGEFDQIIANINRNILIDDLAAYTRVLKSGGHLFLSGFYPEDREVLEGVGITLGYTFIGQKNKGDWTSLHWKLNA